jgi:hypothetical protein
MSNATYVAGCWSASSLARRGRDSARDCAAAKLMCTLPSSATYTTASPSRITPGGRRMAATARSIQSAVTSRPVRDCSRTPSSVRHSTVRWPSTFGYALLGCSSVIL